MKSTTIVRVAAVSGALAVALGALGAHALKPLIAEHRLVYYEKAVYYQFVHTLALLAVALLMTKLGVSAQLKWAAWAFILGILCFSGSLYLLSVIEVMPTLPTGILGPLTPLGGICFIVGWVLLFISTFSDH
jgi:uncharacterized membrane protein YgdD (TMEM256/DUF423 family)